jgi:hypothetical protein
MAMTTIMVSNSMSVKAREKWKFLAIDPVDRAP